MDFDINVKNVNTMQCLMLTGDMNKCLAVELFAVKQAYGLVNSDRCIYSTTDEMCTTLPFHSCL